MKESQDYDSKHCGRTVYPMYILVHISFLENGIASAMWKSK